MKSTQFTQEEISKHVEENRQFYFEGLRLMESDELTSKEKLERFGTREDSFFWS